MTIFTIKIMSDNKYSLENFQKIGLSFLEHGDTLKQFLVLSKVVD